MRIAGGGGSQKGTGVVETLFYNTQPLDKKMPTMKLAPHTGVFCAWEVAVTTGDRASAGTRGSVSVAFSDAKGGSSGSVQLIKARERDSGLFQRAQTDTFQVCV